MAGDKPWWAHVVQWTLWGFVMTLVMGWLARTRRREPERVAGAVVLRAPRSVLVLGIVCTVLFVGAGVGALIAMPPDGGMALAVSIFGVFALMGAQCIADYYMDRFEVGDDALSFRTTYGGSGRTGWAEIVEVSYSQSAKWFRLRLRDGKVVRVSAMMVGLPALAERLLTRATNATIDPPTRTTLTDTAAGNPPQIWAS